MRKKLRYMVVYGVVILLLVTAGCEPTETVEGKLSLNITKTPKITESSPSISSDGKMVVFEADIQGNKEIILRNLETGEITNISNSPANDYQPSISASGKTIVFMSDRTGNPEVYVVYVADVFYIKGLQKKKDGNNNRAVLDFKRAIKVDPFHKASHHQLGTIYDGRKQYNQAIKEFGTVANIYTKDLLRSLNTQLSTATQVQQKDNIEQLRLAKLTNDTMDAHHNLALAYMRNGDKKGAANVHYSLGTIFDRIEWNRFAIAEFKKAIDIDPSPSVYIYNSLGKMYGETEDYEEARLMLEKALQIDSNCVLAYCNLGLVYLKQGLQEKAKEEFDKALQIEPDCPDIYQNLAVYYYEKQDYQKALEEWKTLSKIDPNYPNLKRNISLAEQQKNISPVEQQKNISLIEQQMQKGSLTVDQRQKLYGLRKSQVSMPEVTAEKRHDLATDSPGRALDMDVGDAEIYYQRGITHHKKGHLYQAFSYYTRVIELNPKHFLAYLNRGITNSALGRPTDAISDYTRAINLNPEHAIAYNNRGVAYKDKGQLNDAISDFNKAIDLNPEYARAYGNRGITYHNQGRLNEAISDYTKSLEIDPTQARIYNGRGLVYQDKGQYDQAISDHNKAIKLNPEYAKSYNNRGVAYYKKSQYEHAISDYNEALKLNPKFSQAYLNKARLCDWLGRTKEAVEAYQGFVRHARPKSESDVTYARERIEILRK